MKEGGKTRTEGLALLITVGILTLLAVSGAALTSMAVLMRETAGMTLDTTHARLLARCGIEYASARLFQDSARPAVPTSENQSEDWTFRDGAGTPLEFAWNPSYAQSEPYRDLDADGRYREGVDSYADASGNGRFDSWSGRLRDRHGMTGGTFVLKLLGESGKINLNGGWLDARDKGFSGYYTAIPSAWIPPNSGNGVPDYRDAENLRNRRYVLLLDNLGQIVNVSTTSRDPNQLQYGAASLLGDLVAERPLGGYRSMEAVRGRLSDPDWLKVKDFLTVTETERATFSVQAPATVEVLNRQVPESRPLVNLCAASGEVLQALVLGVNLGPFGSGSLDMFIDPALAMKTSDELAANRPFASWYALYGTLHRDNPSIHPQTAQDQTVSQLVTSRSWASVLFGNLIADEVGGYSAETPYTWFPPMSWWTYDTPRATAQAPPRLHLIRKMGPMVPLRVNADPGMVWRRDAEARPKLPPSYQQSSNHYFAGTLEVSLIPREVCAFSIDCLGRSTTGDGRPSASAGASALIRVGTVVSARSQAELENFPGYSDCGDYRVVGRPFKDRAQTEPQFAVDSIPQDDPLSHIDMKSYRASHPDSALYSPFWGTVRLADRSGYRRGEQFYVPAWDADQPLRPSSNLASFGDNFQDLSGSTSFAYQWAIGGISPLDALEAVFRGERGTSFNCAAAPGVSAPGTYTWLEGMKFPLDDGTGTATRGAVELWTTGAPGGLVNKQLGLYWTTGDTLHKAADIAVFSWAVSPTILSPFAMSVGCYGSEHLSSPILFGEWHHLVIALDPESSPSMVCYLDGKQDPFLTNDDWRATAIAALQPRWILGQGRPDVAGGATYGALRGGYLGSEADELRLYDTVPGQDAAMARALSPRYWTGEPFPPAQWTQEQKDRLATVPSFTSPFYLFNQPVSLAGARWDGFVPQPIREAIDGEAVIAEGGPDAPNVPRTGFAAVDALIRTLEERPKDPPAVLAKPGNPGAGSPLRVELLCYPGAGPGGPCRVVPFPEALWRTGGGWAEFKPMWERAFPGEPIPKFRAFRYRVWMDCSAVDGFNIETPVFDSISLAVSTGGKLLGLAAR